jgi:hypothetical protein
MQILTGQKEVSFSLISGLQHVLNVDVQRIDVPLFPGLSVEDILRQFKRPHDIYDYLPDEIDEFTCNR